MISDLIQNKNVLLAFSDPAGAKAVLSFASVNRNSFKSVVAVSDRIYEFYSDFDFVVETYGNKTNEEWLSDSHVDLIITGTSFPLNLEVSLISEATKRNISSFSFIDHWVNFRKRFQIADALVLPSWICVIDQRAFQLAKEEGLPSERILVTGNPYYEFLASWKTQINRTDFLTKLGLPSDALYVLYAPEPISSFGLQEKYGFTEIDGINMIYEKMYPILGQNIYIIIKGHPNQNDEVFLDFIIKQSDFRLKYFKNLDINTCSYYAECIFGFFSNSLIEAKIMGKLVIRPLMLLKDNFIDPIKEMESSTFLSYYEENKFVVAVSNLMKKILLKSIEIKK